MLRTAAIAAAALGLTACAGQVRTSFGDVTPFYDRSVVAHAASAGAFPLVVHGNPFPSLPQRQSAEAVAREMRLPGWFAQVPFSRAPVEGAPRGNYRLVLVFNPARPVSASEACGDLAEVPVTSGPAAETALRAAFCTRGEPISDARARMAAAGPGSPAFQQLLDQVSATLFPLRNRTRDDDRGDDLVLRTRGFAPHG